MRYALLTVVGLMVVALSGCTDTTVMGLRWAPSEPEKQMAAAGRDLANVARYAGLPPGSVAAGQLADAAAVAAARAGAPKEPVDLTNILPPPVVNAWNTRDTQIRAVKLKERLQAKTGQVISKQLAELSAQVADKAKVATESLIPRIQAIAEMQAMGTEISAAIDVPADEQMTAEQREREKMTATILAGIRANAQVNATRRPSAEEITDKTIESAEHAIDKYGGILNEWGLLTLIPGAGALYWGNKKRQQAKQAQSQLEQADQARKTTEANTTTVIQEALKQLAQAQPTPKAESPA